jgi:hypothetical protein
VVRLLHDQRYDWGGPILSPERGRERPRAAKLPIDDPDYFWSRAKEARVMAEQMTDPEAKRMMLGVAPP